MGESSRKFLQRVIHREVRTHYAVEEQLECGHRFESTFALEPLMAKHRVCPTCAKASAIPCPKKPPTRVGQTFLREPGRYEPPWKKSA